MIIALIGIVFAVLLAALLCVIFETEHRRIRASDEQFARLVYCAKFVTSQRQRRHDEPVDQAS